MEGFVRVIGILAKGTLFYRNDHKAYVKQSDIKRIEIYDDFEAVSVRFESGLQLRHVLFNAGFCHEKDHDLSPSSLPNMSRRYCTCEFNEQCPLITVIMDDGNVYLVHPGERERFLPPEERNEFNKRARE